MIEFIRTMDRKILILLTALCLMFIFAPGQTVGMLGGMLADIFAFVREFVAWFVELITLLYSNQA